jgi:hypothetical protein
MPMTHYLPINGQFSKVAKFTGIAAAGTTSNQDLGRNIHKQVKPAVLDIESNCLSPLPYVSSPYEGLFLDLVHSDMYTLVWKAWAIPSIMFG